MLPILFELALAIVGAPQPAVCQRPHRHPQRRHAALVLELVPGAGGHCLCSVSLHRVLWRVSQVDLDPREKTHLWE